jgi:hypothetical protein
MYQKEDDEQTLKEIQGIIFGNRFWQNGFPVKK